MATFSLLAWVGVKLAMPTGYFVICGIGFLLQFAGWIADLAKAALE